jgi:hypothetical protein
MGGREKFLSRTVLLLLSLPLLDRWRGVFALKLALRSVSVYTSAFNIEI